MYDFSTQGIGNHTQNVQFLELAELIILCAKRYEKNINNTIGKNLFQSTMTQIFMLISKTYDFIDLSSVLLEI